MTCAVGKPLLCHPSLGSVLMRSSAMAGECTNGMSALGWPNVGGDLSGGLVSARQLNDKAGSRSHSDLPVLRASRKRK